MKKFRLKKLSLDEVSLVPSGDDPMAEVVIAKADKTHSDGDLVPTLNNQMTKEMAVAEISKDDLPVEVVEYIEALEATVDEMSGDDLSDQDLSDALDEIEAETDTESVLAKADPAIRELVEKAQAEAEEAKAVAKAERDERLRRDFIEKARTFPMISTNAERLGEILKAVGDSLEPEMAEEIETLLRAANEQITKSNLFDEIGTSVSSVPSSVEAIASEIRKSDPSLTHEQAVAKAYDSNPSLYEQES